MPDSDAGQSQNEPKLWLFIAQHNVSEDNDRCKSWFRLSASHTAPFPDHPSLCSTWAETRGAHSSNCCPPDTHLNPPSACPALSNSQTKNFLKKSWYCASISRWKSFVALNWCKLLVSTSFQHLQHLHLFSSSLTTYLKGDLFLFLSITPMFHVI